MQNLKANITPPSPPYENGWFLSTIFFKKRYDRYNYLYKIKIKTNMQNVHKTKQEVDT